jgi:hypothetical protein
MISKLSGIASELQKQMTESQVSFQDLMTIGYTFVVQNLRDK